MLRIYLLGGWLILFSTSCELFETGVVDPRSMWELLEGDWGLTSSYTINGEEVSSQSCDQLTTLRFRALTEAELKADLPSGETFAINDYIEIENEYCEEAFLNWGTILGKRQPLPHQTSLQVKLGRECYECRFSDIQYVDIESCTTDSLSFQIENLTEQELWIRFVTNVYNRKIDNTLILDTVDLVLQKDPSITTAGEFNFSDYTRVYWRKFDSPEGNSPIGDAALCPDGIDNGALCINDPHSAWTVDESLFSALGPDYESTLTFWIHPVSVSRPKQIIYSKYDNSAGPFLISLEYDNLVLEFNDGFSSFQRVSSSMKIPAGEWTYVTLSYRNQELLLCVNGNVDKKLEVNTWLYDANGTLLLGNAMRSLNEGLGEGFVGKIDEFIFFEKFYGQDVIYQLYRWHLNN